MAKNFPKTNKSSSKYYYENNSIINNIDLQEANIKLEEAKLQIEHLRLKLKMEELSIKYKYSKKQTEYGMDNLYKEYLSYEIDDINEKDFTDKDFYEILGEEFVDNKFKDDEFYEELGEEFVDNEFDEDIEDELDDNDLYESLEEDYIKKKNKKQHLLSESFSFKSNSLQTYEKYNLLMLMQQSNDFSIFWNSIGSSLSYSEHKDLLDFSKHDKNGNTHLSYILENYEKNPISVEILYDVINKTDPNLLNKKDQNMIMMLSSSSIISDGHTLLFPELLKKKLYETNLNHKTINNETTFSCIIKNMDKYHSYLKTEDWNHLIDNSNLNLTIKINKIETSILELMLSSRNYLGFEFNPENFTKIIERTNFATFSDSNRFIKHFFSLGSFHLLDLPNSDHILQILKKSNFNRAGVGEDKPLLSLAFESRTSEILDGKCWDYLLKNTDLKINSEKEPFLFQFTKYSYQNKFIHFKEEQLNYLLHNSELSELNNFNKILNKYDSSLLTFYLTNNVNKVSKLQFNETQLNYVIANTNLAKEVSEDNTSTFSLLFKSFNPSKTNLESIVQSLEKFNTKLSSDDLSVFFDYLCKDRRYSNEMYQHVSHKIIQHYTIDTHSSSNKFLNKFKLFGFPDYLYSSFINQIPIDSQKQQLEFFHEINKISFLNPLVLHDLTVCEKIIKLSPDNFKYVGKHVIEYLELTKENSLEKLSNLRTTGFWGYFKNKETDKLQEKIFSSVTYSLKNQLNFNEFYISQNDYLTNSHPFFNDNYQIKHKVKEIEFLGIQYLSDYDNISLKKLLEESYLKNLAVYSKVTINDEATNNIKLVVENVNTKLDEYMAKIQENLILELKKESAIINFEQQNFRK